MAISKAESDAIYDDMKTGRIFMCVGVRNKMLSRSVLDFFQLGKTYEEVRKTIAISDKRFIKLIGEEGIGLYVESDNFEEVEYEKEI